MTLEESKEIVLITTPPQPRSKLLAMTLPFVPGGPDASMNGLSNSSFPWTVMARLGCMRTPEKRQDTAALVTAEMRRSTDPCSVRAGGRDAEGFTERGGLYPSAAQNRLRAGLLRKAAAVLFGRAKKMPTPA